MKGRGGERDEGGETMKGTEQRECKRELLRYRGRKTRG